MMYTKHCKLYPDTFEEWQKENPRLGYCLHIDYERDYPNGACECGDDYCRCQIVTETKVAPILDGIEGLECLVGHKVKIQTVKDYAAERLVCLLLRNHGEAWTHWGYYGEECDGRVDEKELVKCADRLNTLPDHELIELGLEEEYGHLLPEFKDRKWYIKQDVHHALIQSTGYPKIKLDKDYKPINTVLCRIKLGTKENPLAYTIIDGHHRYFANKKKNATFTVVYCE